MVHGWCASCSYYINSSFCSEVISVTTGCTFKVTVCDAACSLLKSRFYACYFCLHLISCLRHKYAGKSLFCSRSVIFKHNSCCYCAVVLLVPCRPTRTHTYTHTYREKVVVVPDHNEHLIPAPGSWRAQDTFSLSFFSFFSHSHSNTYTNTCTGLSLAEAFDEKWLKPVTWFDETNPTCTSKKMDAVDLTSKVDWKNRFRSH